MPIPRSPESIRRQKQTDRQINSLQFPSDLGETGILLMFKKYSYNDRETGVVTSKTSTAEILDSLYLPLPDQLLETTALKISGVELGALGAGAATATSTGLGGGNLESLISNDNLATMASIAGLKLGKDILEKLGAGGAQKGIEAGMGAVANPFQALTFEGIDLKQYSWNWTFSPKSREETSTLYKIIQTIKKNIHPKYSNVNSGDGEGAGQYISRGFLEYPSVCLPLITGVNTLQIKPCMISQFSVDYGAGGELSFLEGGHPAVVIINMLFQEMQIWTRDDYDGSTTKS